jgi:hypothetical protein
MYHQTDHNHGNNFTNVVYDRVRERYYVQIGCAVFFQWSETDMGFKSFKGLAICIVFSVMTPCVMEVDYQSFTLTMAAAFSSEH